MFISRHGTASDEDELIFNGFDCGETVISCSDFSNLFDFLNKIDNTIWIPSDLV